MSGLWGDKEDYYDTAKTDRETAARWDKQNEESKKRAKDKQIACDHCQSIQDATRSTCSQCGAPLVK